MPLVAPKHLAVCALLGTVSCQHTQQPHLEWKELYYVSMGPSLVFHEKEPGSDCVEGKDSLGRETVTCPPREPGECTPATGPPELLKKLGLSGRGAFLVETLPPPTFPKVDYSQYGWNVLVHSYGIVRGTRVVEDACDAPLFYWIHDVRLYSAEQLPDS